MYSEFSDYCYSYPHELFISLFYRHVPLVNGHNTDGIQAATCVNCGHFFKFKTVSPFKSTITLTVNGQQYTGTHLTVLVSIHVPRNIYRIR